MSEAEIRTKIGELLLDESVRKQKKRDAKKKKAEKAIRDAPASGAE